MLLNVDSESFEPKHFAIVNFYGQKVCFVWKNNEFVVFPYIYQDSTEKLKVYKAPAKIKDIRSFQERVFILCHPSGIYKLTESIEFSVLSKAGVELGTDFCEVLAPSNGLLILENKKFKVSKTLFTLLYKGNVHVCPLNPDRADKYFRKALLTDSYGDDVNLCIISHGKNLYKMSEHIVQIIYTCDYMIKSIEPIWKQEKVAGAVLKTDENVVILVHAVENKLMCEKVFFQTDVRELCATADMGYENTFFFVHSDGKMTYYTKKVVGTNSSQDTRIEEKVYKNFSFYNSQFINYLTNQQELIQVPIGLLKSVYDQSDNDYVRLEVNMLKGLEKIIGEICDKSVELKNVKKEVLDSEDELKRINLFVTKQHLRYCPKESVARVLNQTILVSNYKKVLPKNTIIVRMLKSRQKSIFCMKHVKDCDTVVEMPVSTQTLSSKLYTTTDLITYKNDGKIWCLIKNYIKDPPLSKSNKVKLSPENESFINYKLVVLLNLIKDNNLSMEILSKLKQEIRNELPLDCKVFE